MSNINIDDELTPANAVPTSSRAGKPKFQVSVWTRSNEVHPRPLGKSFRIENDSLVTDQLGVAADRLEVVDIEGIEHLVFLMELNLHDGAGFITSGVPIDEGIVTAPVTTKSKPKKGHISRSKDDIGWRLGTGTYFVVDYDPQGSGRHPQSVDELRTALINALRSRGVDISDLQMIAYESSSSGFVRTKDKHSFDKGGRHLIFLVEDGSDIDRFKKVLFDALTLTGKNYGVVSEAGHLLRRGLMDQAAVSPTQPTFAGMPHHTGEGLENVREDNPVTFFKGSRCALDTTEVRDLTHSEKSDAANFWYKEQERLANQMSKAQRAWTARMGKELTARLPGVPPESIRQILDQRRSGNLIGSDMILLDGKHTSIRDVLLSPEKFDGQTGPDPIEPDYRGGAQTAKVFLNQTNGRPMIHSKAHGGMNYWLWYDARTAKDYIAQKDPGDALAAAEYVIPATKLTSTTEVEVFLKDIAKILGTTKKELASNYRKILVKNIDAGNAFNDAVDLESANSPDGVNDLAHVAARKMIAEQHCIETDDSQVWIYNGRHFDPVPDLYLGGKLRELLIKNGWESASGLSRITKEAISALKELTYTSTPMVFRDPKRILNFQNGELHFQEDGTVRLEKHSPSSGLTSVLSIDYDPDAVAPIFQDTLEQLFWPPAKERLNPPSGCDADEYEKQYRERAIELRRHLEELLAYLIIPSRWISAWFIWIGGGHNGKTFLTQVLSLLLPMDVIESDRLSAFSSNDFGMERLIGKTLVIDDDLETNTTISDGFVKKISETKSLSANRKNKTSITFKNRCALLLLTNNYPRMTDVSHGTCRRVQSLVFNRRFYSTEEINAISDPEKKRLAKLDQADTSLLEQLKVELPGIVNIVVQRYQELVKRDGFSPPPEVLSSNERVICEGNPLPLFIKTQCREDSNQRIKTSEFAGVLKNWLGQEGIRWTPPNRQIRLMMHNLGYTVRKINGHEHYMGISVINADGYGVALEVEMDDLGDDF